MLPFEWFNVEASNLLIQGLIYTLFLTAITSVLSLFSGISIGIFRLSNRRFISRTAALYVEIFRNIPALVLIIFWAFAFPNILPAEARTAILFDNTITNGIAALTGLPVPYYALAVIIALTLNTSAYLAEIFRAGVGTIAQEHLDAARTLGASKLFVLGQILLPQGLRAAFPAISTRLVHNMKNTSLAAFVSVPVFFHSINTSISRSFRALEFLLLAAIVYLILYFLFTSLLRWIESSMRRQPILKNG
jgi:polar amino acid transport system permease protein